MTPQMLEDLIMGLVLWIQDDTQCEYVILLKDKEIRLHKEVKERE